MKDDKKPVKQAPLRIVFYRQVKSGRSQWTVCGQSGVSKGLKVKGHSNEHLCKSAPNLP